MSALFPMETNVDSPKPSSAACPMTAIPSAPLCEEPDASRRGHVVANVPLSCTAGSVFTTPMQFGPISRIPDARHVEELALQRGAVRAGLGEPGGDHDESAHTLLATLPGHRDDMRRRHRDERHVDVTGDVEHARERRDALHDGRLRVDRVHHAREGRVQQVVEEPSADRRCVARRPDHRDGRGLEDRTDGVRRRDPLSILVRGERLGGERRRELDVHGPRRRAQMNREAAAPEDVDHPVVLRKHVCMERRDAGIVGGVGQMRDQDRAEATPLQGVGDADANLRP